MRKKRATVRKVPDVFFNKVKKMADKMSVPATDGFIIRDKILRGDFSAKKKKGRGKTIWEIEFYD